MFNVLPIFLLIPDTILPDSTKIALLQYLDLNSKVLRKMAGYENDRQISRSYIMDDQYEDKDIYVQKV